MHHFRIHTVSQSIFLFRKYLSLPKRGRAIYDAASYQLINVMPQGSIPGGTGGGKMTL